MGWRWLNLWIPLVISFVVAAFAASPLNGFVYGVVFAVIWGLAFYPAVALVGFLTGIVGHASREQSLVFGRGFEAGRRMRRR